MEKVDALMTERTLRISGMHCGSCAHRLSLTLQRSEGVVTADVDEAGEATVRFDDAKVGEQQLHELVRTAGFDVV